MNSRIVLLSSGNSKRRTAGNYQRFRRGADLSRALEPIRNIREVARIMGISKSLVWNLERQALRKIRMRLLELTHGERRRVARSAQCDGTGGFILRLK
jgi:hypothetical protein